MSVSNKWFPFPITCPIRVKTELFIGTTIGGITWVGVPKQTFQQSGNKLKTRMSGVKLDTDTGIHVRVCVSERNTTNSNRNQLIETFGSTRKCESLTIKLFSVRTKLGQFVRQPSNKKQISSNTRMWDTDGKGEELWFQSQEDQELSAPTSPNQLILKMTGEHQTVDHTNKIDHDSIFVWFRTSFSNGKTQTLKTVFKMTLVVNRPPPRHVHLCSHNFGRKNHKTTSLVRPYNNIPVMWWRPKSTEMKLTDQGSPSSLIGW